jgi:hypothetical protein
VTLPRPVRLAEPHVTFSGGALGYGLTYDNDRTANTSPAVLVGRMPAAQGGEVLTMPTGIDPATGRGVFETRVLPAGRYRLFLLTTGRGSAKVTLPELAPRALSTRPAKATAYRAVEAKPAYTGPLAPSAWASGITVDPHGVPSRAYGFQWTDGPVATSSVQSGCVYTGRPPNDEWLPGCPFGKSAMSNQLTPATNCCGTGYGAVIGGTAEFSFGQYYVQSGPVLKAGMFFVWLPDR